MENNNIFCDKLLKELDKISNEQMRKLEEEFQKYYYTKTKRGVRENREQKLKRVFKNEN
jgi:hypothetical protein